MGKGSRYMTRTDFLPPDRILFVDTCGPMWVRSGNGVSPQERSAICRRMVGFGKVFRKRSDDGHYVLTTPLVLGEIKDNVDYYWNRRKDIALEKSMVRLDGNFSGNPCFNSGDARDARKWYRAHNAVYELLVENCRKYTTMDFVSPNDVKAFVDAQDDRLSAADKELLCATLVAGNNIALLSADNPLLRAYREGAWEFGLSDTVICDSIRGETVLATRWKRSNL